MQITCWKLLEVFSAFWKRMKDANELKLNFFQEFQDAAWHEFFIS